MRKKHLKIMILLAAGLHFVFGTLYSQNVSTSTIFPYSKGDIWVYELCESTFCEDEIRFEAIDDSTDNEGTRYITTGFIRTSSVRSSVTTGEKLFRIDTAGNVYASRWMNVEAPALIFNDTLSVDEAWLVAPETDPTWKATKMQIEAPEPSTRVIFGDTVYVYACFL
ncbi:hypothetical protein BH23BAC3_BH23BAC3_26480 [soil metagenome]